MEQIHCLLNCMAEIISLKTDFRPLLFGSWDIPFGFTKDGYIIYFSDSISTKGYFDRFRSLYGNGISNWYEYQLAKEENYAILKSQTRNRTNNQTDIVQLDLYYLYYEKSNYQKNHQPHFVIVNSHAADYWQITDPYYQWEGKIPEKEMFQAFTENPYGGGIRIDKSLIKEPSNNSVAQLFESDFQLSEYPLPDAFKNFMTKLIEDEKHFNISVLNKVFPQFTVLYKTKVSYTYTYSYFAERLRQSGQSQMESVNELLRTWNLIIFLTIKACINRKKDQLLPLLKRVDSLYDQEKTVKEGLWKIYESWKKHVFA